MKGETLGWFRLASHLHLSLQAVKAQTTSSEFVQWMHYFELEWNHTSKQDVYLAQIATEVRRTIVKNPERLSTKDMILQFDLGLSESEGTTGQKATKAKAFFAPLLGGINHDRST